MRKKRQRNPEQTRRRLLAAATVEFSDKGLKGARISGIARRAGTNYQAIYHHFGSKEKIYEAVLESMFIADWFEVAYSELRSLRPIAAIEYIIDALVERMRRDSYFPSLFIDQNLQKGRHLEHIPAAKAFFRRVVEALAEILERGVDEGTFRRDVDASLLYITLSTEISMYFSTMALRSVLFGRDMGSHEETQRWLEHFKIFVFRGLHAD